MMTFIDILKVICIPLFCCASIQLQCLTPALRELIAGSQAVVFGWSHSVTPVAAIGMLGNGITTH